VKLLGIEMPGWVSVMFFPVTDSLGGTIAENCALYTPPPTLLLMNDIGSRVAGALPPRPDKGGELSISRRSDS
jgi:hypothetical protein